MINEIAYSQKFWSTWLLKAIFKMPTAEKERNVKNKNITITTLLIFVHLISTSQHISFVVLTNADSVDWPI